jgi:prepilin-type N-terminal cleavage/methylation domain-containing protein
MTANFNRNLIKSSGFTLLEVMVAVSLMGMALVPLLIAHAVSVRNFTHSKQLTEAALLAGSELETRHAEFAAAQGEEGGTGDEGNIEISGDDEDSGPFQREEKLEPVGSGEMFMAAVAVTGKGGENRRKTAVDLNSYFVKLEFSAQTGEEE